MAHLILTLVSMLFISIYLAVFHASAGLPSSISETYYKAERRWLFPTAILLTIGTAVAPMFDLTPETWKWLVFLIVGGILFVAGAPAFKDSLEGSVHAWAAIVAGVAALGWLIVMRADIIPLAMFGIIAVCDKTHRVFWLEAGFAVCIYVEMISMCILNII